MCCLLIALLSLLLKVNSMMRHPFVIITALEHELDPKRLPPETAVVYTGIGKVNAAIATFKAIQTYSPREIINFGTVGRINPAVSGLLDIGRVVQRDVFAEPLAPRGEVPFSTRPNTYVSDGGIYVCGSGDSFVTESDPWLIAQAIDVVDMELFAMLHTPMPIATSGRIGIVRNVFK